MDLNQTLKAEVHKVKLGDFEVSMLREDLIHPEVMGNKWRKLKYNLLKSKSQNDRTILTFGGAFSNHIAATAAAGQLCEVPTIGIIRGEESSKNNPTLSKAAEMGMKLVFVDRETYKMRYDYDYWNALKGEFGNVMIVSEGGSNYLGFNGCIEILGDHTKQFSHIALPIGTGCTAAGILTAAGSDQQILGFSALKGVDTTEDVRYFVKNVITEEEDLDSLMKKITFHSDDHFGGYAKINEELMVFIKDFYKINDILLDPVYTGKMMFYIHQKLKEKELDASQLLCIHTGGIQGFKGFEHRGVINGLDYIKK